MSYSAQFDRTGEIVQKLNPSQKQAALHDIGPALVLAGPGTGKTETLTSRVEVIVDRGTPLRRVLALTYTRRAADSMKRRLGDLFNPNMVKDTYIGTFHAIIHRLMISSYHLVGFERKPSIFDERQCRRLLSRRRLFWKDDADILRFIQLFKDCLVEPNEVSTWARQSSEDVEFHSLCDRAIPLYVEYQAQLYHAYRLDAHTH